jgi:hypothetical protein
LKKRFSRQRKQFFRQEIPFPTRSLGIFSLSHAPTGLKPSIFPDFARFHAPLRFGSTNAYYRKHRKRIRANAKRKRAKNLAQARARDKKYYNKRRARIQAYRARYRAENRARLLKHERAYYLKHRARILARRHARARA